MSVLLSAVRFSGGMTSPCSARPSLSQARRVPDRITFSSSSAADPVQAEADFYRDNIEGIAKGQGYHIAPHTFWVVAQWASKSREKLDSKDGYPTRQVITSDILPAIVSNPEIELNKYVDGFVMLDLIKAKIRRGEVARGGAQKANLLKALGEVYVELTSKIFDDVKNAVLDAPGIDIAALHQGKLPIEGNDEFGTHVMDNLVKMGYNSLTARRALNVYCSTGLAPKETQSKAQNPWRSRIARLLSFLELHR